MTYQDYRLSKAAEIDISHLYDYTKSTHGAQQAETYLLNLHDTLNRIVSFPESGRPRPEVKGGLRSIVYEHHVVFYRLMQDYIRIVRVLHASRDIRKIEDLD